MHLNKSKQINKQKMEREREKQEWEGERKGRRKTLQGVIAYVKWGTGVGSLFRSAES